MAVFPDLTKPVEGQYGENQTNKKIKIPVECCNSAEAPFKKSTNRSK